MVEMLSFEEMYSIKKQIVDKPPEEFLHEISDSIVKEYYENLDIPAQIPIIDDTFKNSHEVLTVALKNKKIDDTQKKVRVRKLIEHVTACIYIGCANNCSPITLKFIDKVSKRLYRTGINIRVITAVKKSLGTHQNFDTLKWLECYTRILVSYLKLDIADKLTEKGKSVYFLVKDKLKMGKHPRFYAIAILMFLCKQNRIKISQKDFSKIFLISETLLKLRVIEIEKILE